MCAFSRVLPSLLMLIGAAQASEPRNIELQNWRVSLPEGAQVLLASRSSARIVYVSDKSGNYTLVAKDAPPQSIRSIENRIQELKGESGTLKRKGLKKSGSLFMFASPGAIHWYSTTGGHLVLAADPIRIRALFGEFESRVESR